MHQTAGRFLSLAAAAAVVAGGGLVASVPTTAEAADTCSALSVPVFRTIRPSASAQLLTRWQNEAEGSTRYYGFTDVRGVIGYGSSTQLSGYVPVTRMYNSKTVDFLWVTNDTELTKAQASGYVKQAVNFYAPSSASSCAVAVHRYVKGAHARNAWTAAENSSLLAAGWTDAGTSFYLKPASNDAPIATTGIAGEPVTTPTPTPTTATPKPTATATTATPTPTATATTATPTPTASSTTTTGTGGTGGTGNTDPATGSSFSVAVIGDTQNEVMSNSDTRFSKRTAWLASKKDSLNLKYVLQTGDLGNYAWLDTAEFARAKAGLATLTNAGVLYNGAIGNHDTAAVGWNGVSGSTGYGGSAYAANPECASKLGAAACNSNLLVRNTSAFNSFFPVSGIKNVGGAFESGKADNIWTTFEAGNTKWMVLTLELWPRTAVVNWAKDVVASHPNYNVIIQTHHYLDGDANISGSNGGYGANSPSYLRDQLVSKYSNIKMVFSGHVGSYTDRAETYNGNAVVAYLGDEISGSAPLRTVTIDPATGTVKTTVYDVNFNVVGTTSNTIKLVS